MFQQANFGIDPNNGKNAPQKRGFFFMQHDTTNLRSGIEPWGFFPSQKLGAIENRPNLVGGCDSTRADGGTSFTQNAVGGGRERRILTRELGKLGITWQKALIGKGKKKR